MRGYRSADGLAMATIIGAITTALLRTLPRLRDDPASELAGAVLGLLTLACALATAICFFMWLARSYRNLPSLGAPPGTMTPGWAVGGWFIPIFNLYHGYHAMRGLWRASRTPSGDGVSPVGHWWALHLASVALGVVALYARGSEIPWRGMTAATSLVTTLVFVMMLRGVGRRQREQRADVLRRALSSSPPPMERFG